MNKTIDEQSFIDCEDIEKIHPHTTLTRKF